MLIVGRQPGFHVLKMRRRGGMPAAFADFMVYLPLLFMFSYVNTPVLQRCYRWWICLYRLEYELDMTKMHIMGCFLAANGLALSLTS